MSGSRRADQTGGYARDGYLRGTDVATLTADAPSRAVRLGDALLLMLAILLPALSAGPPRAGAGTPLGSASRASPGAAAGGPPGPPLYHPSSQAAGGLGLFSCPPFFAPLVL